jgi:hypothetical protein
MIDLSSKFWPNFSGHSGTEGRPKFRAKLTLGAPFFPRSRPKKWAPRSLASWAGGTTDLITRHTREEHHFDCIHDKWIVHKQKKRNFFGFGCPRCDVVFAPKADPDERPQLNNAQTIVFDYSKVLVDIDPDDQDLVRRSLSLEYFRCVRDVYLL